MLNKRFYSLTPPLFRPSNLFLNARLQEFKPTTMIHTLEVSSVAFANGPLKDVKIGLHQFTIIIKTKVLS